MKRFMQALLISVLLMGLGLSQTVTVKRNVNLRPDPSTDNDPIVSLTKGDQLTLIDSGKTDGFWHVRTSDNQEGWVWAKNVKVQTGSGGGNANGSGNGGGGDQDLLSMLFGARIPAVGQPLKEDGQDVCGPEGDATDSNRQTLNDNKNRTDAPAGGKYVPIAWSKLRDLPSNQIPKLQGAPVVVEGFLSHQIKVENEGSGESTNCHLTGDNEVDWHIYLTNQPNQGIADAVIIETTPRTRPAHKWTKAALDAVVNTDTRVRISGWLMYDFEHTGVVGTQRASVWEVHPITRIEVMQNGQFVDLDTQ